MALTITDLTDYFDNVPSIQDPTNFEAYAGENMTDLANVFASGGDIHTFISETNALAAEAETNADDAETAKTAAEVAQVAAAASANATIWLVGTTYGAGARVLDPGDNYHIYISQQAANTGTTPNTDDGTWWKKLGNGINIQDYSETVNVIGDLAGGSDDIDLESGNVVTATVSTGEQTFTFSNPSASGSNCSFTLKLINGGSQTINWPGSVDWAGGTAPTLTASGIDTLVFETIDAGTIWSGYVAGLDIK